MENDPAQRGQSAFSPEERLQWSKELSRTRKLAAGLMITGLLTIAGGGVDLVLPNEQVPTENNQRKERIIFQNAVRDGVDVLAAFGGVIALAFGFNGSLNTKLRREALERGEDPRKVHPIML